MITNLLITGPFRAGKTLRPGDDYQVFAWSDSGLVNVSIKCFVRPPTPPEYKECDECGAYEVESGQSVDSQVSEKAYRNTSGFLNIVATDNSHHVVAETIYIEGE